MLYTEISNDMLIKSPLLNPYETAKLKGVQLKLNANIVSAMGDKKLLLPILASLMRLAGQRPMAQKAKESVAAFKVRKFSEVGAVVTLRGRHLANFLLKFRIYLPYLLSLNKSLIQHHRLGIADLAKVSPGTKPGAYVGGVNVLFSFSGDKESGSLYLSRLGLPA